MAAETDSGQYPAGTGWLVGSLLAAAFGVVAWAVSGEVVVGVIALGASGPPLGIAFERSLDTRPLTERQRRNAVLLAAAGVVVGLVVLLSVLFA